MDELNVIIGTGPLGLSIMHELRAKGFTRIRLINRTGQVSQKLPLGVEIAKADVMNAISLRQAIGEASVLYQAAQPLYTKWSELFPAMNHAIIEGAAASSVKLIVADNLYMYGPVEGLVTESLPYAAIGPKGKTRAEIALTLIKAHQQGQIQVAIGRSSDFYGPEVRGSSMGESVFGAAMRGKTIHVMGDLDALHTYTYIKDFARGLVILGEQERSLGEIWHIPSAETITTRQLIQIAFDELGTTVPIRASSRSMMSIIGWFSPMIRELKELYYEFDRPFIMDHEKFKKAFDMKPTPHLEAVRDTIAWYRSHLHGKGV